MVCHLNTSKGFGGGLANDVYITLAAARLCVTALITKQIIPIDHS
jgi:hypothetical protein